MTLDLRLAADPEDLLDALVDWCSDATAPGADDPFHTDLVVVPNAGVREWVSARLTQRLGVLAGIEFVFPGEVTRRLASLPARAEDPWSPERLAWQVLGVLADGVELGATPWQGHPGRPWATARRVADLLEAYGSQRPDLIAAWAAGQDTDGLASFSRPLDASQRWQAALWRALRARIGQPSPAERLREALAGDGAGGLPERLALFGVSRLSGPAAAVIARAGRVGEVLLLATAPSPARVSLDARDARDGVSVVELALAPERVAGVRADRDVDIEQHPLLTTWGASALESGRMLARLASACAHAPAPVSVSVLGLPDGRASTAAPVAGRSQLTRLRAAVAAGVADDVRCAHDPIAGGDGSVQVHACHGLARQLEVLRDALLHALESDPSLQPRDIAVLCVDLEAVAPLAGPILGAEVDGRRLPVLVTDRAAANVPLVHQALDQLLGLAVSRLQRDEVLAVLAQPAVRLATGLDEVDLELLGRSAAALDVRWGMDAEHRVRWGYPAELMMGTWREALDRLLVGLLFHPELDVVAGLAPARESGGQDVARIGRLADVLTAIGRLVRLGETARAPEAWARELGWLVDTFLRPREVWDAAARAAAAQAAGVREVIGRFESDAAMAGVVTPLDVREVRAALGDLLSSGGATARLRTGHVSVASLTPLRGVPFRVVAVVGVDDDHVGGRPADADDVLAATARAGERDAAGEYRASLLDAVLAARDRLIITCDGQDIRTGDALPLSTTLEELLEALPSRDPAAVSMPLVLRHPRHLVDRRNLVRGAGALLPAALTPWTFSTAARGALAARDELVTTGLGGYGALTAGSHLREDAPDGRWRLVLPGSPARTGPDAPPSDAPARELPEELSVAELVAALRAPARTFLRHRLGVRLPADLESSPRPIELWPQGTLESWRLGDDLLAARLAGASASDWMTARPARGGIPPGRLGSALLQTMVDEVEANLEAAQLPLVHGEPLALQEVPIDVRLPQARLVGTVPHVGGRLVDVAFTRDHDRHLIAAWVHLLAATAVGVDIGTALVVRRHAKRSGPVARALSVRGVDVAERRERATETLRVLVDLALRIRRAPVALLPRAGWALAAGVDPTADLTRDLQEVATTLVFGPIGADDLRRQAPTAIDEGLPEADYPALQWGRALAAAVCDSTTGSGVVLATAGVADLVSDGAADLVSDGAPSDPEEGA